MKNTFLISIITVLLLMFYSCSDDSTVNIKKESVTMGAGYADDIYYSLENGVVAQVNRTGWDIAFSVAARSSSILINEGAGVTLKEYPAVAGWNWNDAIDTTGYATWDMLFNSDTTWEEGAFGQNATGHPNYGWGNYNSTTHDVNGDALFIIKLTNGEYKKIFIEVKSAMGQEYIFKYAGLDGSNEKVDTIQFADLTENFVYYSMVTGEEMSGREPDASTWDILITKYKDNSINYEVVGLLQNIGVKAIEKDGVLDLNNVPYENSEYSEIITTIGHDWKSFNHENMSYEIDQDRVYFVKDQNEKEYKLVFTGFDSGAGNITFDITSL